MVLRGYHVLCVIAADLVLDLGGQETAWMLERLGHYVEPRLLAIDKIGYLTSDKRAADLLFQVLIRRYGLRSLQLSTNLAFKDRRTIYPTAAWIVALVDRLTHHAEIITMAGESCRWRETEAAQKARRDGVLISMPAVALLRSLPAT